MLILWSGTSIKRVELRELQMKTNKQVIQLTMIALFVVLLLTSCVTNQNNPAINLKVSVIQTIETSLFGLKAFQIEIAGAGSAVCVEILSDGQTRSIDLQGSESLIVSDFFTHIHCQKLTVKLLGEQGKELAVQQVALPFTYQNQRPLYSQFNEGIYFEEAGQISFYQLEYLASLTLPQRIALYYMTLEDTITTYVMLLKGGDARFCLYADYPVDIDDPSIEEFPYDRVHDVENDYYFDPANEETIYYGLKITISPEIGGQAGGEGYFEQGQIITLSATPSQNYRFVNWTQGENEISSLAQYAFNMPRENVWLRANFEEQTTRLKDLGPEGSLQETGNVYNILDNTFLGYWSISIRISGLPGIFQSASAWHLIINGNSYPFTQNSFENDIYETYIEDTEVSSIEDIRNATFMVYFE